MELVQELLVTASLTLILSLVVAKLVSMAMSGGSDHDSQVKSTPNAQEIVMEDIQFSTVQSFQSETKLQESLEEQVEEFRVERPLHLQSEEIVEIQTVSGDQIPELPEKSLKRALEEEPQVVELPEKLTEVEIVKESLEKKAEVEESLTEKEVIAEISEETRFDCSEEEDDWEGIERSELEKAFAAAAKFVVESGDKEDGLVNVGSDVQLELYGLHKVATEGPCRESQPMPLKLSARAKWNAWQKLGNMSPEVAMEQYMDLLADRVPGWTEDKFAGGIKTDSSEAVVSSTVAESSEAEISSKVAPDASPDYIDERKPEQKGGAEEADQTGGSNLEDKAKE
ncbi:hypothetical protein SO802_032811 [Lithocarpus litseifolius]|uniref:ACB domain-containing protein n=1 Tax=Lithocarpus litseifolius TaxID=425828 RepID=A0AAW2BBF7_9ROSI